MTYRSLCLWLSEQAAVRLSERYRQALSDLYDGVLPEKSMLFVEQRVSVESCSRFAFIDSLDNEVTFIKAQAPLWFKLY